MHHTTRPLKKARKGENQTKTTKTSPPRRSTPDNYTGQMAEIVASIPNENSTPKPYGLPHGATLVLEGHSGFLAETLNYLIFLQSI
jgi:hypothetical protein